MTDALALAAVGLYYVLFVALHRRRQIGYLLGAQAVALVMWAVAVPRWGATLGLINCGLLAASHIILLTPSTWGWWRKALWVRRSKSRREGWERIEAPVIWKYMGYTGPMVYWEKPIQQTDPWHLLLSAPSHYPLAIAWCWHWWPAPTLWWIAALAAATIPWQLQRPRSQGRSLYDPRRWLS